MAEIISIRTGKTLTENEVAAMVSNTSRRLMLMRQQPVMENPDISYAN